MRARELRDDISLQKLEPQLAESVGLSGDDLITAVEQDMEVR